VDKTDTRAVAIALALSFAATGPQLLALSLLMPDISQTLNISIALLGQLNTIFSIVCIVVSLAMGFLTVKYSSKTLLLTGIATLLIGVVGGALSSDYTSMILFFILYGAGLGLVFPVTNLLMILFPQDQRTRTMGWVYSGRSLTSIIATPIIGFLAASYGWRAGYIGFGLPLIAIAGILILFKIPQQRADATVDLTKGFRDIRANSSAVACLIAAMLALIFFNGLMVYNGTYLRNNLGYGIEVAAVIMSFTFIAVAVGQVASGVIASGIGARRATYLATLICGASLLAYFSLNLPPTVAILFSLIGTAAAGILMTSLSILALGLVPESRGTMMSLVNAGISIGNMLSSAIGGLAIGSLGFAGFGATMFTLSLVAAIVLYRWTRET
jgi:predicted MFS family arabinose efflux permease